MIGRVNAGLNTVAETNRCQFEDTKFHLLSTMWKFVSGIQYRGDLQELCPGLLVWDKKIRKIVFFTFFSVN